MLSVSRPVERTPLPPGYRHGISTPVTSGLKLFCDSSRLQPDTPVRPEAYPSPPMSGSPPLPSTAAHKGHASGNAAAFTAARLEGTHAKWPTEQLHVDHTSVRDRPHGLLPLSRSYPQETPSRSTHIRRLSENVLPSVSRYGTQDPRGVFPIPPRHSPGDPHGHYGTPTPIRDLSQDPNSTLPRVTSPKSQRKAKGHVASACLPCKRAHLRCDAQRPCSRCVSNGKEANCKDIQHKKRGRPRLRDERDARLDSTRFSLPHDLNNRRPLNMYQSAGGQHVGDDPLQRHSLNHFEYATSDPAPGPNFLQRVLSSERSPGQPGQPQGAVEEPVAYLNMGMEFVKVSSTFVNAVGSIPELVGRTLADVTTPKERDRIMALREGLIAEQKRLEPNYLPPIFDKGDHVARRLGLMASDISERQLDRRDYITFVAANGHLRPHPVRLGIFKEATFYFIILFLNLPTSGPYHSPPAHHQNGINHAAQPAISQTCFATQPPPPPPAPVSVPVPVPPSFEAEHRRFSDGPGFQRPTLSSSAPHLMPNSPHAKSHQPMYSPASHGGDYTRPSSLQIPRSELGVDSRPANPKPSYTLPPIRPLPAQGTGMGAGSPWQRDERQRRMTIGGLIDRPEISGDRLQ